MTYLIRLVLLAVSIATITPVARGATLESVQPGFQQQATHTTLSSQGSSHGPF